jgi:Spy/CpxP family protein refolding chaperone
MPVLALVVALAVVAAPAAASEGQTRQSRKWWTVDSVRAELRLTPQQSDDIEQVFQSTAQKLRAAKAELDRQEAALDRLLTDRTADEAQVVAAIDRVEAARSELGRTRALMLFRMHRLLTPEQVARLKAIHDKDKRSEDRDNTDKRREQPEP